MNLLLSHVSPKPKLSKKNDSVLCVFESTGSEIKGY